jgi:hypothetical protein
MRRRAQARARPKAGPPQEEPGANAAVFTCADATRLARSSPLTGQGHRTTLCAPIAPERERPPESYRHLVHMSTTRDSTHQIRTGARRARLGVPMRLWGAVPSRLGGEPA